MSVPAVVSVVSVSAVCDQVDQGDQVVPAHQVDDIDDIHEQDPVHQVDHKDEHTSHDITSHDITKSHPKIGHKSTRKNKQNIFLKATDKKKVSPAGNSNCCKPLFFPISPVGRGRFF